MLFVQDTLVLANGRKPKVSASGNSRRVLLR